MIYGSQTIKGKKEVLDDDQMLLKNVLQRFNKFDLKQTLYGSRIWCCFCATWHRSFFGVHDSSESEPINHGVVKNEDGKKLSLSIVVRNIKVEGKIIYLRVFISVALIIVCLNFVCLLMEKPKH